MISALVYLEFLFFRCVKYKLTIPTKKFNKATVNNNHGTIMLDSPPICCISLGSLFIKNKAKHNMLADKATTTEIFFSSTFFIITSFKPSDEFKI